MENNPGLPYRIVGMTPEHICKVCWALRGTAREIAIWSIILNILSFWSICVKRFLTNFYRFSPSSLLILAQETNIYKYIMGNKETHHFSIYHLLVTNTKFYLHSMGRKNSSVNNELKQYLTCKAIVLQKLYCTHHCVK